MEGPASKRFREDDNSNGADEEEFPTIPSLVSHIFLSNLKDTNLLKSCRLVCKSWNIDATESLRSLCSLFLLEDNANSHKILNLLLERESGPLQNFPSPLENIQAGGERFSDPAFVELLLLPNIKLTTLRFHLSEKLVPHPLGFVLAANQSSIRDLSIIAQHSNNYSSFLTERILASKDRTPMALKSFKLEDNCSTCSHFPFLSRFLSSNNMCSKLERLDLNICDGENLNPLLTLDKFEALKHLSINVGKGAMAVLTHVSKLKIVQLESLRFEMRANYHELSNAPPLLGLLFESVPQSLKEFVTNIQISNQFEFSFPKLEKIKVWNNSIPSALNLYSFPALSKVCLEVRHSLLFNYGANKVMDVDPHPGVRSLAISIKFESHHLFDQQLLSLLTGLSRQFPQVYKLKFSTPKFSPTTIPFIYEAFPRVRTLGLDGQLGNVDSATFWGVNFLIVKAARKGDKPIVKFACRKSIKDFMELEKIWLGEEFVVGPGLITRCWPRLTPKIKQFNFHWNKSITAETIVKSMGHFEKICISYSEIRVPEEISKLSELSPNVYFRRIGKIHPILKTKPVQT